MKAEERHRLQENDLVKGINTIATGTKRPSTMILLMVGLVVALGLVYWYWSTTAANRVSRSWVQYYEQRDRLEDTPANWKSGPAGQAIQLGAADTAFERGFTKLFIDPQQALKDFEAAATQYEDLSKIASNSDIQVRALVGAARAYENVGNTAKALELYDSLLTKYSANNDWKDHPLIKDAKEHQGKLTAKGDESMAELYQSWASKLKQVSNTTGTDKPPAFPNIPMPPIPK